MYSCSRKVVRKSIPSASASPICARFVGIQKQKAANVNKKKNVKGPSVPQSNKSYKKPAANKPSHGRGSFRNIYADVKHDISPIVQSLAPEIGHELYSKFCIEVLKNYGLNLQLSDNNKQHHVLSGEWTFPGRRVDVAASCALHQNGIDDFRNKDSLFNKPAPNNTVGLLINNVGFRGETIRKFVRSENPCVLMSVSDSTSNWLGKTSSHQKRRETIEKCLHHQLWDQNIGFSTHKFSTSRVTIPKYNLTQGLSLLLFNKAFISKVPKISAGKFIYQWPSSTRRKRLLKTYFYSTVLMQSEEGKVDLFDVLQKEKMRELELYYAAQMRHYNESRGVDVSIGDIIGIEPDKREEREECDGVTLNHFSFLSDETFIAADDVWRVH